MQSFLFRRSDFVAAALLLAAGFRLWAQPFPPDGKMFSAPGTPPVDQATPAAGPSSDLQPPAILDVMQRVADWQLAHWTERPPSEGWVIGVADAGMMALAGISGDTKYRDAMAAQGETNGWQLGRLFYDADDHCIGQAYAELYLLRRDPKMIAPLRERFDGILANPSRETTLKYFRHETGERENWTWCDAMFMGPPTWMRLYAATGDRRYLDFAVTNWWRTTDYLYETNEHLFYRDDTYFDKQEANGRKIFWARGNGWVMGGLARTLEYMPRNEPDRARYEQQFRQMAAAVAALQDPHSGLWHSDLLDAKDYPQPETSGSALITFGLAWGVNHGLLSRARYKPVIAKAWHGMIGQIYADGRLGNIQQTGAAPAYYLPSSSYNFGVGAFLLAGAQVEQMVE